MLLIPGLSWSSEEKARELYVKAEVEFNQSGCSISEFKKISEAKLLNKITNLLELSDVNSIKLGLIDLIKNDFDPSIGYFDKCLDPYLKSIQPNYEKIVTNYPSTELALTIRNNDYVTKKKLKILGLH